MQNIQRYENINPFYRGYLNSVFVPKLDTFTFLDLHHHHAFSEKAPSSLSLSLCQESTFTHHRRMQHGSPISSQPVWRLQQPIFFQNLRLSIILYKTYLISRHTLCMTGVCQHHHKFCFISGTTDGMTIADLIALAHPLSTYTTTVDIYCLHTLTFCDNHIPQAARSLALFTSQFQNYIAQVCWEWRLSSAIRILPTNGGR